MLGASTRQLSPPPIISLKDKDYFSIIFKERVCRSVFKSLELHFCFAFVYLYNTKLDEIVSVTCMYMASKAYIRYKHRENECNIMAGNVWSQH